jgi:uncharacterized Zn finger protein
MGMFDTVKVTCPSCGEVMELQTKAGNRTLEEFESDDVPTGIALDLAEEYRNGNNRCLKCGTLFRIVAFVPKTCIVRAEVFHKKEK